MGTIFQEVVNDALMSEKVAAENTRQRLIEQLEHEDRMSVEAVRGMREAEQQLRHRSEMTRHEEIQ